MKPLTAAGAVVAAWIVLLGIFTVLVLTRPSPRTDRDRCNDNTNTTWRCDTEVVFVPSTIDAGILYEHRETRDYCRCQKGW